MNWKRILILLLSVAVILMGAFLPSLVSSRLDAGAEGEIRFATINDIQLEFSESDVSLREIISILCTDPEAVDIPVDLTNLKQERAESLALDMAKRLEKAEIAFHTYDGDGKKIEAQLQVLYSQPRLASSNLVDGLSNIFWYVEVSDPNREQLMQAVIDDRTGTVCSLNYSDENMAVHEQYRYRNKETMKAILYSFSYLYLEELGEEYFDYDSHDIQAEAQSPLDNSYIASSIRWWAGDNEFRTTFFINGTGFYTYHAVVSY